ncbi:MAG TPA: hypothetical protein VEQ41_09005 [Solirubrobacterales bacterium]|nr:hypothetical protein [Solirubrobacterales bacterium]
MTVEPPGLAGGAGPAAASVSRRGLGWLGTTSAPSSMLIAGPRTAPARAARAAAFAFAWSKAASNVLL